MLCAVNLVERVLRNEITPIEGEQGVLKLLEQSSTREYSQNTCALRLCKTLGGIYRNQSGWHDICSQLRQCILFYNKKFMVSEFIGKNIEPILHHYRMTMVHTSDGYETDVLNILPEWFGEFDEMVKMYKLEPCNVDQSVIGDSRLYNMTGYSTYRSATQKILVNASLNMPNGTTLLGCMTTGEGKSLVGMLPQYYEDTGTTIIVVPTVSLAIDQARAAEKYYKNKSVCPVAYHSKIESAEKQKLLYNLREGVQPILYISPEAILNGVFFNTLLEMAKRKLVNRLVIDEAHIVTDWGAQFRTEFQLLSVFRRKLLKESDGFMKTILLSATLTEDTIATLKGLFSEGENYIGVRGDGLRAEIQYYVDKVDSLSKRIERIKEIIPLLPRPLILYTLKPYEAEEWKEILTDFGYKRIESFTGEISNRETREEIITRWDDDEIDIMIATSAFGMGVDKKDVRGVVHCCMPESINRYYQEVGRGGRDGFPSISLLSVVPEIDRDHAFDLINKRVLTIDTFIPRWEALRTKHLERVSGNSFWVDTGVKPDYLGEKVTGKTNAAWNEYVLLLLYRKGLIEILDVLEPVPDVAKQLLIKVKNGILNDLDKLAQAFDEIRNHEKNLLNSEFEKMKQVIYCSTLKQCLSTYFKSVYPRVETLCGGCPSCRAHGRNISFSKKYTEFETGKNLVSKHIKENSELVGELALYTQIKNEVLLVMEECSIDDPNMEYVIGDLIEKGVNLVVIPTEFEQTILKVSDELFPTTNKCFMIADVDELCGEYSEYPIAGNIAFLYNAESKGNYKMYKLSKRLLNSKEHKIIHVAPKGLEIQMGMKLENNTEGTIGCLAIMEGVR